MTGNSCGETFWGGAYMCHPIYVPSLHLIHFNLDRVSKNLSWVEMVHVEQNKAFDRFEHLYFGAVLEAANLGPSCRGWIKSIYGSIWSSVQVDKYLSELFNKKIICSLEVPLITAPLCIGSWAFNAGFVVYEVYPRWTVVCVSVYADDVNIIVSSEDQLPCVEVCIVG